MSGAPARLRGMPGVTLEGDGTRTALVQPDGARWQLPEGLGFEPDGRGAGHGTGKFTPGPLSLLDGWLLFPPDGDGGRLEGLPPLVSTRDLSYLRREAEIAARTAPPDPGRLRGLALAAAAVLAGAREAGLTCLEEARREQALIDGLAPGPGDADEIVWLRGVQGGG